MSEASCNNVTVASCLQRLRDSKFAENHDDEKILEWLGQHIPESGEDALEIVESLTNCWEKYGVLETLSADARILMLKAVQNQLTHAQVDCRVFLTVMTLASKILRWCEGLSGGSGQHKDLKSVQATSMIQAVLPEALMLTNAIFSNLENCLFFEELDFIVRTESYVCQFLDSLKTFCMQLKKEELYEDFHRYAQELLSEALKVLLKLRTLVISACGEQSFDLLDSATLEWSRAVCHGVNVFVELGKFASTEGREWVGLLNVAWKGVTTFLQTAVGSEVLTSSIDIPHIIKTMVSCMMDSLKRATEHWKTLLERKEEAADAMELKRLCIPMKFFLINVIRVITNYPCQSVDAFMDMADYGLKITALQHELREEAILKPAAEAIVETVEPSLFILFHTVLSSLEVQSSLKLQLIEFLVGTGNDSEGLSAAAEYGREVDDINNRINAILAGQEAYLQLGRLTIFLGLLQTCCDCGEDITCELVRSLDLSLQLMTSAKVYAKLFRAEVQPSSKGTRHCLFFTLSMAIQGFFVALANTTMWIEAEEFLFRNILHPHALCRELILELWCFLSRHCEAEVMEDHIQDLLVLLTDLLNSPDATHMDWPIRTVARLICTLVKAAPDILAPKVYELVFGRDLSASLKWLLAATLLKEHFAVCILPEELKSILVSSVKTTLSEMWFQLTKNSNESSIGIHAEVQLVEETLCCLSELLVQEEFEQIIPSEEIHELTMMTNGILQFSHESFQGKDSSEIRCQSLKILSRLWQKMSPNEVKDAILALHGLVKNRLSGYDLRQIKPMLTEALAGLGDVVVPEEGETDAASCALWDLFHVVLMERHWAFAHLALTAFGYFAARTSCNELWRFVPDDAALAYDGETGKLADEDSFMSSLRRFLEKEVACNTLNGTDFRALQHEGEVQESAHLAYMLDLVKVHGLDLQEPLNDETMDAELDSDEKFLPAEITQAMKMLQEGMLLLKEKLPMWLKESQSLEQHQVEDHLCLLADVIGQLDVLQHNVNRPVLNIEGA